MCRTRDGTFRKDRANFVKCALSYIGLNDLTTDCERTLSRVAALECGTRSQHMKIQMLSDSMMVALHVPRQIDALVWRTSAVPTTQGAPLQEHWRPKEFITRAKNKYLSFFGCRRLAPRMASKVAPCLKPIKIRRLAAMNETKQKHETRCKFRPMAKCETRGAAKQKWRNKVQQLTDDMRDGKPRPSTTAIGTNMPSLNKKRKIHPHVKATLKQIDELKEKSNIEAIEQQMSHGLPRPPKALDPPRTLKPTFQTRTEADWEGIRFWNKSQTFAKQRAKQVISTKDSEKADAKKRRLEIATKGKHAEHECTNAEFQP